MENQNQLQDDDFEEDPDTQQTADGSVEHGIDSAYYAGGYGEPYYQPCMDCICGFSTGRCESWSEAGAYLDDHLLIAME